MPLLGKLLLGKYFIIETVSPELKSRYEEGLTYDGAEAKSTPSIPTRAFKPINQSHSPCLRWGLW